MPKVSPYSRPDTLTKLDRRTRESRLLQKTRADLTAHVGGSPSATERVLIERAAALTLQVALMDAQQADGRSLSEHDSKTYLAWVNTLTRLMRQLGLRATAAPRRSLAEHIATRSAAA